MNKSNYNKIKPAIAIALVAATPAVAEASHKHNSGGAEAKVGDQSHTGGAHAETQQSPIQKAEKRIAHKLAAGVAVRFNPNIKLSWRNPENDKIHEVNAPVETTVGNTTEYFEINPARKGQKMPNVEHIPDRAITSPSDYSEVIPGSFEPTNPIMTSKSELAYDPEFQAYLTQVIYENGQDTVVSVGDDEVRQAQPGEPTVVVR